MALALLGGAARAVGGQMAKSGGKTMAKKMMNRGDKKQKGSVSGGSAQQDRGIRPKTTLIPASTMKSSGSRKHLPKKRQNKIREKIVIKGKVN